jgi:hypothetical protein
VRITSADDALLDCKRRFENLPERHFKSVEAFVRKHFVRKADTSISLEKDFRHSQ